MLKLLYVKKDVSPRMTTVKQLEQELNVSRVSLYAILKRDWFDGHITEGKKGVMMVDDEGVAILRDYYFKKNRGGTPRKNVVEAIEGGTPPGENGHSDDSNIIGILQEQLAIKDEQINSLLSIVSNQQKLHA